ncbi:MAG: hypothetical protein ACW967_05365 [Candidatus Hodarchaeales archaeon]
MSDTVKRPVEILLKQDCQYFDSFTDGCDLWGSCKCETCPNYVKITNKTS